MKSNICLRKYHTIISLNLGSCSKYYVASDNFLILDNNIIIKISSIRYQSNKFILNEAGNIVYGIIKSKRKEFKKCNHNS